MPAAAIRGRSFSPPFAKFSGKSTWKSSSVPIQLRALRSCPSDGSSSAPSPGSIAVAAWPRIGSASTERPWRSCALPQSASCSESSVKKQHDPGQTLKGCATASNRINDSGRHLARGAIRMSCGAVRRFNETKGYGFIQPDDGGGKAAFIHIKAVQKAGFNGLVEGGKIAFRRRARSEDWKHLPEVLGDGKMRRELSSSVGSNAVRSIRHQIIISAHNAL